MNISIKQRVGCILFSILLVVCLIGSFLCALILPFMSSNGVAKAESANGVVNSNLLLNGELSLPVSSFNNYIVAPNTNYAYISTNRSGDSVSYNNGLTVFSSSSKDGGMRYQVVNPSNGTYTVSFSCTSFPSQLRFWVRRSNWSNYLTSTPLNSSSLVNGTISVYSFTFTIADTPSYIWLYFDFSGYSSSNFVQSSFVLDWIKLEQGSSFTGYVPKDYINYGYNQGYEHGVDSISGLQNFSYIGNLGNTYQGNLLSNSLLDLDFTFNNVSYSLNNNYVHFDDSGDFSFYYVSGTFDTPQPGVKVVSDLLFGTIQIAMPYYVGSGQFIDIWFEDTITGQVVSTNYQDTLHFKFIPWSTSLDLSNEATTGNLPLNAWYFVVITYFFENPQNIYFLPHYTIRIHDEFQYRYPSSDLFNIYSTQSLTALSSFDEGYQKGIKDGADGAVQGNAQAVANARAAGYEQGRRDALDDSNDYSFMGLLGAVFDAPIKSFQGLLNFDVLGVNMQSFVLALLSLSVIIIIIKIALGGK